MRRLAQIFIVLFCVSFLASQARSQNMEIVKLATLIGQVTAQMLDFTSAGFAFVGVVNKVQNERLEAIENHLAKTSRFTRTPAQAKEWKQRLEKTKSEFRDETDELLALLDSLVSQ